MFRSFIGDRPDREGEAISWHLEQAFLNLNKKVKRIEFNEITEDAVLEAVRSPREIDTSKVNSQQARRILDRLLATRSLLVAGKIWKQALFGR